MTPAPSLAAPPASRLARLLLITFIESFATILVERGVYFYITDRLGFGDTANLWFALGYGVSYVAGALLSHAASRRLGEKRLLVGLIVLHFACHAGVALLATRVVPFVAINFALAMFTGAKWPVVESYISAGKPPSEQARAIGMFNVGWALAAPPAIAAVGGLITWWDPALFALAAAVNVATLALLWPLDPRPAHLALDHPERLPVATAARYRVLVVSGRWSMLASYTLLFLLLPLLPTIFVEKLGLPVEVATPLTSLFELIRAGVFVVLLVTHRWHGRADLLAWSALGLPLGFLMVLFGTSVPEAFPGQHLATVLAGEAVFGLAAGLAYYAALYYAMVLSNASVESGGAHESLVGGGFAIGPAVGLLGYGAALATGHEVGGMLLAVTPVVVIFVAAAVWPMRRLRPAGVVGRG